MTKAGVKWLVETVLLTVKAILFVSRGLEADPVTNRKSGEIFTFSLIALDPDNRFRYPPVSLFFMMCLCLQIARLVQENLFDMRFFWGQGRLVGANSAWLRNHEMTKFWSDLTFPKGYANFGGPAGGCSLRARCPQRDVSFLIFLCKNAPRQSLGIL